MQAEDVGMIEVIIEEIRQAAEEEIRRILKEAEEEAKRIVEEAKQRAKELREEKIRQLVHEYRSKLEREYAPKRLEIRRRYVREKYEKLLGFFDDIVSSVVREVRGDREKYRLFLRNSAIRGFRSIKSGSIIIHPCRGETETVREVLDSLSGEIEGLGKNYRIGEEIECDGGLFLESEDGHEYYNATIRARIAEIRESLLPSLAEKLLAGL